MYAVINISTIYHSEIQFIHQYVWFCFRKPCCKTKNKLISLKEICSGAPTTPPSIPLTYPDALYPSPTPLRTTFGMHLNPDTCARNKLAMPHGWRRRRRRRPVRGRTTQQRHSTNLKCACDHRRNLRLRRRLTRKARATHWVLVTCETHIARCDARSDK